MQVIILAGGLATRLYPTTKITPKSMIGINDKPFIYWQLSKLKQNGIKDVVLCVGNLFEQIVDYVKDGSKFGLNVKYSYDGESLLGTGGSIKKALDLLDDSFFILYGDSYVDVNYSQIEKLYNISNKQGLMAIYKNNNHHEKSNIIYKDNKIIKYDKKIQNSKMHYIDYGLGILNKNVFKEREDVFDLADIYSELAEKNQLIGCEIEQRYYEIGSVDGIKETEKYIKKESKDGIY
jgi:NDP-sugar pyrophosphorylase family protein